MHTWRPRFLPMLASLLLGVPIAAGGALLPPAANAQTAALVQVATNAKLGPILVNGAGMTLYTLSSEAGGVIQCSAACLGFWPPLTVPAGVTVPTAAAGVTGNLSILTRTDG